MVERIEINQKYSLVENLLQQLGVPKDRVENIVRPLEKLLGERMVDYFKKKVAAQNNPGEWSS